MALTESYADTTGQLKFNLALARDKLEVDYGSELITQILGNTDSNVDNEN